MQHIVDTDAGRAHGLTLAVLTRRPDLVPSSPDPPPRPTPGPDYWNTVTHIDTEQD